MTQTPYIPTVDASIVEEIKLGLAFPLVEDVVLTDEQLKKYCIGPALKEYFRWYPIQTFFEQSVSEVFTIPFPDNFTYAVMDARLNNAGQDVQSGTYTGNRILDILALNNATRTTVYGGSYNTPYNFGGLNRARIMERTVGSMQYSNRMNQRVRVNRTTREVTGYANVVSKVTIIWAKWSYNFADVRYEHQRDVIDLAKAYMWYQLGDATSIMSVEELPVKINGEALLSKAKEERDRIITRWNSHTKIVVIPKNLGFSTGLM